MASKAIQANSKQNVAHAETNAGRPKRVCSRKSYCEVETDDELAAEDVKQYKPKGGKRKESYSFIMLEKKQRQIAQTLRWLSENYELKEGMCLPRCVMYTHYLDFCRKEKLCPAGPATFGKIIRQRFPKLTTRRLGTRGQSKYHYYGIVVRETSPYFHAGYSKKGLTRFSGMKGKGDVNSNHKKFSLSSKSGTLLPEFPNVKNVQLPDGVSIHKVETFIMMYRTHCQRMLDTVVSANFEGVQNFITHFWKGMPSHIISVLECPVVVDIVAICDSILYKVLTDVLIPSTIQDIPESLREEITDFADNLLDWLVESLTEAPPALKEAKFEVARTFTQALKRQACFVHLAQAARSALLSYEDVSQMLGELTKIDFCQILSKCFFISGNTEIFYKAKTYVGELESLLSKQAPLEAYIEWLDSVVDRCVMKQGSEDSSSTSLESRSRKFLALWSFVTARVLTDLTLRSAPSFGVFHLIHTAFEEYVFLVVENLMIAEMDRRLNESLETHLKKENQTLVLSNETELDKPKENMQPERQQEKPKETPRPKRQKIITGFLPTAKEFVANDKIPQQHIKPRVHADFYPPEGQYTTTCAPSATLSNQQLSQTSPLNIPSRQFMHPTSLSVPVATAFPPLQSRPSLQPVPMTDLHPGRDMVANVPEINSFQGDFINAIDKAFFSSKITLNLDEYMGTQWVQNEAPNLTVLNPVDVQEHTPMHNGVMAFPGNGNYSVTYDTTLQPNDYPSSQSIPTNPRTQEIPYTAPTKDDFGYLQSLTNAYPRYNPANYHYDPMRNVVQPGGSDAMAYNGLLNPPANSFGMDAMPSSHDVQLNRLGIGAV